MEELFEIVMFWMDLGAPERPDAPMWQKVVFLFAPGMVLLGMGVVALVHWITKLR